MKPSEPSFPEDGATLDLDRKENPFKIKWGDKVEVGESIVVDTAVASSFSPLQVRRLVARHSKGKWSDAGAFDGKEEREDWDHIQETSLLLGCRVSSLFNLKGTKLIVWTERPLRDKIEDEDDDDAGEMPHTIVREYENLYAGDIKVSDVL